MTVEAGVEKIIDPKINVIIAGVDDLIHTAQPAKTLEATVARKIREVRERTVEL